MAVKRSDLRAAAERVSSDPTSFKRTSGGAGPADAAWSAQQALVARAVVVDPDLVAYFAYLVSNRACALAKLVAQELSDLAVAAEGQVREQGSVEAPTRLAQVLQHFDDRAVVSGADVARIGAEADSYIRDQLVPQVTRRGRTQVRGAEARARVAALLDALTDDWRGFREALTAVSSARRVTPATVRNLAVRTPLVALRTTSTLLDPTRLTDFTVQLAAAASAVAALGREFDLRTRLRTGDGAFPRVIAVSAVQDGAGVTGVLLSESPRALGVRSGDAVRWGRGVAVVLGVDATSLTFGSSTITAADAGAGVLQVLSAPYLAWQACAEEVDASTSSLPSRDAFRDALQQRSGAGSAAHARVFIEYLVGLAAVVDAPSDDALAALSRVGGSSAASASPSLEAHLRTFSPSFSVQTRQTGEALLRGLEERGFDYAVEMLYRGDVDQLLGASAGQASRVGRVGALAGDLGRYTGG